MKQTKLGRSAGDALSTYTTVPPRAAEGEVQKSPWLPAAPLSLWGAAKCVAGACCEQMQLPPTHSAMSHAYPPIIAVILRHSGSCMPHRGICACLMDCGQHLSTALQDLHCLIITPSTQQATSSRHSKVQHTQRRKTAIVLTCRASGAPGMSLCCFCPACMRSACRQATEQVLKLTLLSAKPTCNCTHTHTGVPSPAACLCRRAWPAKHLYSPNPWLLRGCWLCCCV